MDEVSHAIGSTPLLLLEKLSDELGVEVFAKYEAANPGGSIKDRAALMMLDRAEERGTIQAGRSTLVEPTSGNTGIALAMLGAARGYRVVLTMPESMSKERRMLLAAYGAELVLTPAADGLAGAVGKAEELCSAIEGAWIVGQFANPDNPLAHETHTAPEILAGLGGDPDFVVTGAGTGGTISGVAHFFKARSAPTRFFAVEPAESPLIGQTLSGDALEPSAHGIQGIGPNFVPENLDFAVLDGAIPVTTQEAYDGARWAARQEGLLVGVSSGANIAAVRRLVQEDPGTRGGSIVTFLVDTGERYLSTPLFEGGED